MRVLPQLDSQLPTLPGCLNLSPLHWRALFERTLLFQLHKRVRILRQLYPLSKMHRGPLPEWLFGLRGLLYDSGRLQEVLLFALLLALLLRVLPGRRRKLPALPLSPERLSGLLEFLSLCRLRERILP